MKIEKINSGDFTELSFQMNVNFQFKNDAYCLEVVDMYEIGMANYVLEIVIKKNGKIEYRKTGHLPQYWQFTSSNNNFLAIPTKYGAEIINLENNEKYVFQREDNLIVGNQFSEDGNFMILIQSKELNLISTRV